MRQTNLFLLLVGFTVAGYAGCQSDETSDDTTSGPVGPGPSSSSSGTGASGGATNSSSTGVGGAGVGGSGGQGGGGVIIGDCSMTGNDHVLLNELVVGANAAEYIEIYNPGSQTVDLTGYYLSDNSIYYHIAEGTAFAPIYNANNMGSDFLVAFPPGTMITAGGYLTIQTGTDFFGTFASCPDFALQTGVMCNGNAVTAMTQPLNGDRGTAAGTMLSNGGEMVMLFCWDGTSATVKDVDYVTYDNDAADQTHVDKTGETGYLADTAVATQISNRVNAPPNSSAVFGLERCSGEDAETTTGGNGIAGHDETSEQWSSSWQTSGTQTPGAANSCQ